MLTGLMHGISDAIALIIGNDICAFATDIGSVLRPASIFKLTHFGANFERYKRCRTLARSGAHKTNQKMDTCL